MKFPEATRCFNAHWLAVAFVGAILFGIGLRVFVLDGQGYWHDEVYSVSHLSGFDAYVLPSSDLRGFEAPRRAAEWIDELDKDRYWETLSRNLVHEGHPPFYQLGLKGWTSIFGQSIKAVRSFSVIPALLTIPIFYLLGLRFRGPLLGAGAALLIAVSPYHLFYSVEARNYAWSLFFSALALLSAVSMWTDKKSESGRGLAFWWLGVVGACYTHYYAGLYCAVVLIILFTFRRQSVGSALKLGFPFLLFLPWLPVLQAQLDAHSAQHWTVGAPGAFEAGAGFVTGLLDQLTGVYGSATTFGQVVAAATLIAGGFLIARDPLNKDAKYDARWLFLSVPAFGTAVLGLDLITNHHTILVSRYLISVVPLLLLICAWLVTAKNLAYRSLFALLVSVNLIGCILTATGDRAPKQMLREAGAYIGDRYSAGDVVLVTPSGPTLVGLARYLPSNALIGAAPPEEAVPLARRLGTKGTTVWLARQNLGIPSELQKDQLSALPNKKEQFAGIDIIPVYGTGRR